MPTKKSLLNRRERIIQAADTLFDHYGHDKTTMQDIARESGVPRATIYLEFPAGKDDIVMASIARYLEQSVTDIRNLAARAQGNRLEALLDIFMFIIFAAQDRMNTRDYKEELVDVLRRRVYVEMDHYYAARREIYQNLLEQAARDGEIHPAANCAEIAVHLQLALKQMFLQTAMLSKPRAELEPLVRDFYQLLFHGIPKP